MVVLKDFAAVKLPTDRIDFGSVMLGREYDETIKIKNTGTINLRIIETTHSPDVYPVFTAKIIKPGDEAEIKIVFTPMQTGRFATFLKIRTNAFRQRLMIVKLSADVQERP